MEALTAAKSMRRDAGSRVLRFALIIAILIGGQPIGSYAQSSPHDGTGQRTVLGVRNQPLKDGANALLARDWERGVELTHKGLEIAVGAREEEAALSNLCAGYLQLGKYHTALMYCDMLLTRNDRHWRGYNNRALIYIKTRQWDKADADLTAGESINSGAHTLKVARAMYMDAVYPVAAEIEIDDRKNGGRDEQDEP